MAAATSHAPLKPISNGPNMSISGHVPNDNQSPRKPSASTRTCSQCKGPLPRSLVYGGKRCEACREKEHERAMLYAQRATIRAELAKMPPMRISDVQPPDFRFVPQKRKAEAAPDASCSTSSGPGSCPAKTAWASRKRIEYQTEDAFFSALSAQLDASKPVPDVSSDSDAYLNFFGGYTIVFDPDVYPDKRVALVIAELESRTTLPLGPLVKSVPGSKAGGYSQHHWCTCSGVLPPAKPSLSASPSPSSEAPSPTSSQSSTSTKPGAPVQRSQSMLMKWLATGSRSKSMSTPQIENGVDQRPQDRRGRGRCGGTITITAVVDMSHPLASDGLKGQRVTVQVQHPGRFV
ncbi:hypothetical protein BV20DRAFT_968398 [Pilatotrama ljubarskyi]|nr:hypothetical protein BV20DRAFT_968398 [Pilatotrama ljubarskyi]